MGSNKKPHPNYLAFQKQHFVSYCVDTTSGRNALFFLYNLRWNLFFCDNFEQFTDYLACRCRKRKKKKKLALQWKQCLLIFVLKYKASASYTSSQNKKEQLKNCWFIKLKSKASIEKITEMSNFKIFQLGFCELKDWRKVWTRSLKEFWQARQTKHFCNTSWVLRSCYKMTFAGSDLQT